MSFGQPQHEMNGGPETSQRPRRGIPELLGIATGHLEGNESFAECRYAITKLTGPGRQLYRSLLE